MKEKKQITVLGLGNMGIKLAELLADSGEVVTVWNRTIEKASGIRNAHVEPDLQKAVSKSAVYVICVYDYAATWQILHALDDKSLLEGKTVINFTTGAPEEAEAVESWLKEYAAGYINGALQAAPDQMGLAETTILLSGDKEIYDANQEVLKILGGNLKYLGSKASLASAVDLASLSWLYGSYIGLIYGVAMCEQVGVDLEEYSKIITEIAPGFTQFFKHQIRTIDSNNFSITQSPLAISVTATQRIYKAVQGYGMDAEFWQSITALFSHADRMGLGNKEVAAMIGVIDKKRRREILA
jgi:3-hydroxyisobutyrate dehydrogenase-like beta-hydroxyacid dehydrogenase